MLRRNPLLGGQEDEIRRQAVLDNASQIVDKSIAQFAESHKTREKFGESESRISTVAGVASNAKDFYTENAETIAGVKKALDDGRVNTDIQALEADLRGLAESSKLLMKALDAVSQAHPFIAVAVLAFKGVISLILTSRDNDRKVIHLMVEMQDMLSVLRELEPVRDPQRQRANLAIAPGRMQELMEKIAKDIVSCGNACDDYTKKHPIVKIVKSMKYESRLARFVSIFADRRTEIERALSIHTTLAVDAATTAIATANEKLDTILVVFQDLYSPREKDLKKIIEANGGEKCIDNDKALRELHSISRTSKDENLDPASLTSLRKELKEGVEETLEKNMIVFGGKLKLQMEQLGQLVKVIVQDGTDQVLDAVGRRLHNQVEDPHLRKIWVDMDWKGSVKARHFVLALYDYFNGNLEFAKRHLGGTDADPSMDVRPTEHTKMLSTEDDEWALHYIGFQFVQPLLEAFDDDGTGFVSIKEANTFTTSRPKGWSLLHWIAFWGAGWNNVVWDYKFDISGMMSNMFNYRSQVLPVNRQLIDAYLSDLRKVESLVRSTKVNWNSVDVGLSDKVTEYVTEEKSKMGAKLQSVGYQIDAANTLALLTGPGRIEQYIYPLLFLLLRHHLRIFKIACEKPLDEKELSDASGTLDQVFEVIQVRINNISAIFRQKNADVAGQFENFAFGMFRFLYDPNKYKGSKLYEEDTYGYYFDNNEDESETSILKFGIPPKGRRAFNLTGYEAALPEGDIPPLTLIPGSGIPSMLGTWTGYAAVHSGYSDGLMRIVVERNTDDGNFEGWGEDGVDTFTVSGRIEVDEGSMFKVTFTIVFARTYYCQGQLNLDSGIFVNGGWGYGADEYTLGILVLGRTPLLYRRFLYSPEQFSENPARARWSFACKALKHQVKMRMWSWGFKSRSIERQRLVDLWERSLASGTYSQGSIELSSKESTEFRQLLQFCSPADYRLYFSIAGERARSSLRNLCVHFTVYCDNCNFVISGDRIVCLHCINTDLTNQINLCSNCADVSFSKGGLTHNPTHSVFKVRQMIHERDIAASITSAQRKRARALSELDGDTGQEVHTIQTKDDRLDVGGDKSSETEVTAETEKRCIYCEKPVSLPCWLCASCDEVFICDDCHSKKNSSEAHDDKHDLIQCQPEAGGVNKTKTIEASMAALGDRIAEDQTALRTQLARLEVTMKDQHNSSGEQFTSLERKVEGRLTALENRVEEHLGTLESLLRRFLAV